MKILYLTDTHFTAKNPSSRLDNIQDTIISKLNDVKDIINDVGIDIVIHGGDMFHSPDVSNQLTGKIAEILKTFNAPIYVVPGNHDVYGYQISTLYNSKLGLLERTGVIKIITRKNPLVIDDNGFKIGIEAQEYHSHIDENMYEDFKIYNLNVDYNILVTHSMLLEHKFHPDVKYTLIKDVKTTADLVLAGHYHDGFKETCVDDTWFFNPGSFLRMEASTQMLKAIPKVVVFDIKKDNFSYDYIELPSAKAGSEVFNTKKLSDKMYDLGLIDFHNKLKNKKFKGINIVDLIDDYAKENQEDIDACIFAKDRINEISINSCDKGYISQDNNISITKVEIYNFQAHEKKIIEFVDGLNTIVGESNSGKTSILRAIYWGLYDRPSGNDFIRTGAKSCKVIIHLSNGYIVERKRSNSSSGTYKLTNPDGTVAEFKGFSNNIPVEILNATQMPEIKVNGLSYKLNVAMQLDSPFLIGNSNNERLSLLGALVDADRADSAKRSIDSEKKRTNLERKQLYDLKAEKEFEIKKYDNLDKMKKDIELLELVVDRIDSDEEKINTIKSIYDNYTNCIDLKNEINNKLSDMEIPNYELLDEFKKDLAVLDEIKAVSDKYNTNIVDDAKIKNKLSNIPDISIITDSIVQIKNDFNLLNDLIQTKNNFINLENLLASDEFIFDYDVDKCKSFINEHSIALNSLNELIDLKDNYYSLNLSNEKLYNSCIEIDSEISKLTIDKNNKIEELKNAEPVCKYCGSKININKFLGDE